MGVTLKLGMATKRDVEAVAGDFGLLSDLFFPDMYDRLTLDHPNLASGVYPNGPRRLEAADRVERSAEELDKAWHGIHYLLTGSAWAGASPLNALVAGGTPLDNADGWDDGPPRYLAAEDVVAFTAALAQIPNATLRARFDPIEMTRQEIYPTIIWQRDAEEALSYLMTYVSVARCFFRRAADCGLGVVLLLS